MACFSAPLTEAIVVSAVKAASKDGAKHGVNPFLSRLGWLQKMLFGGSFLLAIEHVWHGEVVPWFPFLTNAADPADAAEMLSEMSTVGVGMALAVTGVWAVMAVVSSVIEKRKMRTDENAESEGAV